MDALREQINKRLTLNLLVQGSAQHAFLTSHYVVRDELSKIDPRFIHLYDQFALLGALQYWYGVSLLTTGSPRLFWKRVSRRRHPFHQHPFLCRHGAMLAEATRAHAVARSRAKGIWRIPVCFSIQLIILLNRIPALEARHKARLESLARQATHQIWGIPFDRLDAELTKNVAFGSRRSPKSFRAAMLRSTAAGYGGVMQYESELRVTAKAWMWPILSHELVKGTAELICLHGLNTLDHDLYTKVLRASDRIEYEPWMLQAGPELWRRVLALMPDGASTAKILMRMARLAPEELERLMMAIVEDAGLAREWLGGLAGE